MGIEFARAFTAWSNLLINGWVNQEMAKWNAAANLWALAKRTKKDKDGIETGEVDCRPLAAGNINSCVCKVELVFT